MFSSLSCAYLHVAFLRVDSADNGLQRHPLDRQRAGGRLHVLIVLVNVSCHPEVAYFQHVPLRDQDISGRHIPVNALRIEDSGGLADADRRSDLESE